MALKIVSVIRNHRIRLNVSTSQDVAKYRIMTGEHDEFHYLARERQAAFRYRVARFSNLNFTTYSEFFHQEIGANGAIPLVQNAD